MKFWEMTPEEFAVHFECFARREAREADRIAIFLCNMRTAMWSKRKPKPKDFLGRPLVSDQRKRRRKAIAED